MESNSRQILGQMSSGRYFRKSRQVVPRRKRHIVGSEIMIYMNHQTDPKDEIPTRLRRGQVRYGRE
jgi:hypothetical protein